MNKRRSKKKGLISIKNASEHLRGLAIMSYMAIDKNKLYQPTSKRLSSRSE